MVCRMACLVGDGGQSELVECDDRKPGRSVMKGVLWRGHDRIGYRCVVEEDDNDHLGTMVEDEGEGGNDLP